MSISCQSVEYKGQFVSSCDIDYLMQNQPVWLKIATKGSLFVFLFIVSIFLLKKSIILFKKENKNRRADFFTFLLGLILLGMSLAFLVDINS